MINFKDNGGGTVNKFKAAAAAMAVAGATAASLVAATGPAQAASTCKGEAVSFTRGVAHATCKSGAGTVRVKIQCMDPSGTVYFKYGAWVYSTATGGDISTASCNGSGSIMKKWAEVR
jgi:hypothetical protein